MYVLSKNARLHHPFCKQVVFEASLPALEEEAAQQHALARAAERAYFQRNPSDAAAAVGGGTSRVTITGHVRQVRGLGLK